MGTGGSAIGTRLVRLTGFKHRLPRATHQWTAGSVGVPSSFHRADAVVLPPPRRLGSITTLGGAPCRACEVAVGHMPREALNAGPGRRLIAGDRVMLALVYFTAGTEVHAR